MSILSSLFGKSANELYQEAVKHENKGMYNDAIQLYNKAIGVDPKFASPYNALAWIYALHNSYFEQALIYANKAITLESNPEDKAVFIDTRAEIYIRMARLDEAIQDFNEYFKISGGVDKLDLNYGASYRLGFCYYVKQDFNNASLWINKAIERKPQNPFIYSTNGDICLAMERYTAAINSYKEGIEKSSNWNFNYPLIQRSTTEQVNKFVASSLINMGVGFYNTEDYDHCWLANSRSYELYKSPVSIANLASLAARSGDKASMRRLLEEGIPLIDINIHNFLINFMITHPNLEEHRNIVLDLLRNHNKISQPLYVQYKKAWQERRDTNINSKTSSLLMSGPIKQVVIGSSNYLEGGNMSNFKTNIGGDSIGLTNVGGDLSGSINFGSISKKTDLIKGLEELKGIIDHEKNKKTINEDIADSASLYVEKAIDEANKPTPDSTTFFQHLSKAKNFIEHVVGLATGVGQLIAAAKKIFP